MRHLILLALVATACSAKPIVLTGADSNFVYHGAYAVGFPDSIDTLVAESKARDPIFVERTKLRRMLEVALNFVRDIGENHLYPTLSQADMEQHARNVRDKMRQIAEEP